jgi:hypothetical protein
VRYPFLLALAIAALTANASTERGTPAPAVGRRDCHGCGAPAVLLPPRRDPPAAAAGSGRGTTLPAWRQLVVYHALMEFSA